MKILACLNGHSSGAFLADVFATKMCDIVGVTAENAGWLVLFQDNFFLVNVDLQRVFFCDAQGAAQFDRDYHPAELVHLSYDTG
jgi:hypothetical protein